MNTKTKYTPTSSVVLALMVLRGPSDEHDFNVMMAGNPHKLEVDTAILSNGAHVLSM